MSGCRGDPEVLEAAVWKAIENGSTGVSMSDTPLPDPKDDRSEQAQRLRAEAEKLRRAAQELLDAAKRLEEAAKKLESE